MASRKSGADRVHALQVRAFLNASEDVDIDEEILMDLVEDDDDDRLEMVDVNGYFVDDDPTAGYEPDALHETDDAALDGEYDSDDSELVDEYEAEGEDCFLTRCSLL
jgi:NAD-dependent histone deacetylase SIR2